MLNKIRGNMYQGLGLTHTWNPLSGKCPHGCLYCSTNKFYYPVLINKYSGPPRLEEKELKTNLGKDNYIFVASQNDLFADGIDKEITKAILHYCCHYDNKYLFQTKNPKNCCNFIFPENSVICTTIETNRWYGQLGNAPDTHTRAVGMTIIGLEHMVTIEPIMKFDLKPFIELIKETEATIVNIGANTSSIKLPEPSKEEVLQLISELEKFTKVNIKSNLKRIIG